MRKFQILKNCSLSNSNRLRSLLSFNFNTLRQTATPFQGEIPTPATQATPNLEKDEHVVHLSFLGHKTFDKSFSVLNQTNIQLLLNEELKEFEKLFLKHLFEGYTNFKNRQQSKSSSNQETYCRTTCLRSKNS